MAEIMATMVIGPLVSMVKDKASSSLLEKYQVMEGMEEQHEILKRKLPAILDVISDAEEQAAAHREGAKAWLEALRKVAYKANDVFDEFKYEALRREAKKNGHYKKLGMDFIKLFPTHNRIVFRYRMGIKLRMILHEVEVLVAEMNAFKFKFRPQPSMYKSWRHTYSDICGPTDIVSRSRAEDKQKVVNILLDQASNTDLTVLPIVGMGGLGKTTFAQLIYNDRKIQEHFQLLLWVCVSDNFDVDSLAKSIAEAANKEKNDNERTEKPPLDSLQKVVRGKRYLLVLDDVWSREANKWEKLKSCLQHGSSGSSVLTTTRDAGVAHVMGTTGPYQLNFLGENFIKEIIMKRAFSSQKQRSERSELVEMVGDIAKKCGGSPLAASALGSVLRTKTSVEEWKVVLSRSTICDEENGILPILNLSYNDLPSHMKQCFAFCAMFPKDYEIDVEILIRLWMANGFIPEQQGVRPEIIGENTFFELESRSFFQDMKRVPFDNHVIMDGNEFWFLDRTKHGYCSKVTCKIHDLMHDVAQSAMGKECSAILTKLSKSEDFPYSARHLFLSVIERDTILDGCIEKGFPAIQTLTCDVSKKPGTRYGKLYESLQRSSKYSSVRALSTPEGYSFLKPKYLHHLRYLDISRSAIQALPEDISILYHLQTLNLSSCYRLERIPREIKYLTSLRHLYTHECRMLKSMPADLGQLTCLQTLTYFAVGGGSGCSKVDELQHLDLGGQLELTQLENVTEADSKAANLGNKKLLTELALRWTCPDEEEEYYCKVLEGLKPHKELKVLKIYSYWSVSYPTWMNTLQHHQMVELVLSDCKRLEKLPPLWQLPALRVLLLWGLGNLHCLCSDNHDRTFKFQKLKYLLFHNMQNFETWWDINEIQGDELVFPQLEDLIISKCERLPALPKVTVITESSVGVQRSAFPALKNLELYELTAFQRWEAAEGTLEQVSFPLLEKLSIWHCPELATVPKAPKLSELTIKGRNNQQISLQGAAQYITSLSRLDIESHQVETTLLSDREKWNHKYPLETMELYGCDILFCHSNTLALWRCLAQLVNLRITNCDVLVHWPEEVFRSLVSLRTLTIWSCNKLTGCTQAYSEQSKAEMSKLQPCIVSLDIQSCASLVEVPNLPASLKKLCISNCKKLECLIFSSNQQDTRLVSADDVVQFNKSALSAGSCSEATSSIELSSSANAHFLPYMESFEIWSCDSLSEVSNLPPSIKTLSIGSCTNLKLLSGQLDDVQEITISDCGTLKSLESCFGELTSLEELRLERCKSLVSLPKGPQAYSSLRHLCIKSCPGIKVLPSCLQERLTYIEDYYKDLDARYEGPKLSKPKTWKYAISRNW